MLMNWRIAVLLLGVALVGCSTLGSAAKTRRDVTQYTIDDFLDTTSYRGASFSPDCSKVLVSSDQTGVFNVYVLPTDGGEATQLTHSTTDSFFAQGYFPDDERFLYSADQGGNELTHLYVQAPDGSVKDVTPGENLKAAFLGFAEDGESFYVMTNERDSRFFDLYEYPVDTYERQLVFQNEVGYMPTAISADGRQIALVKTRNRNDNDIHLWNRDSGEIQHVTPHEGDVNYSPQSFSFDGSKLYFLTDQDSEFKYLAHMDLETHSVEQVLSEPWDVQYAYFSDEGTYLVVAINQDARTEMRVYQADTMKTVPLKTGLADVDITSVTISSNETRMALYVSSSRHPSDLFVGHMGAGGMQRLTRSLNPNIKPADMVDGEVVRFGSYDGLEIPGILYRPHQVDAAHKAPALIMVHGGPGGQSRVGYRALTQYLVNHGYVVYSINNRGSSGYGKSFFQADDRRHGEADLDDCVASKKMLAATGYVDADRIGIIGGSYGGYMVLAGLAFRPEEFEVGVDIFGVANWVRTLESIPPWWESMREALYQEMGDPASDRERLHQISPVFHGGNIVKPLLVLQGANDPRVLQQESDDMVAAARASGAPVEYVVFEDEGHGFQKKENQRSGYQAILEFCDRYLKGDPTL